MPEERNTNAPEGMETDHVLTEGEIARAEMLEIFLKKMEEAGVPGEIIITFKDPEKSTQIRAQCSKHFMAETILSLFSKMDTIAKMYIALVILAIMKDDVSQQGDEI